MKVTVRYDGATVDVGLATRGLKLGTFAGSWAGYEVTSPELPDLLLETTVGVRGRVDVTIEVAP